MREDYSTYLPDKEVTLSSAKQELDEFLEAKEIPTDKEAVSDE